MPTLDASFLETDPNGAAMLRSVLDTGRRGRRRKVKSLVAGKRWEKVSPASVAAPNDDLRDLEIPPAAVLAALAD
jgi:hypothetical protein